jgi:hypothetical protein
MKSHAELNGVGQPKVDLEPSRELIRERGALLETECEPAAEAGIAALRRIAQQTIGRDYGGAIRLRKLLLSLFRGDKVNLSEISYLDWNNRKDFAAVLLSVGQPSFPDYRIREIFKEEGDFEARWFLGVGPKARRGRTRTH